MPVSFSVIRMALIVLLDYWLVLCSSFGAVRVGSLSVMKILSIYWHVIMGD